MNEIRNWNEWKNGAVKEIITASQNEYNHKNRWGENIKCNIFGNNVNLIFHPEYFYCDYTSCI